jgi:hypothetical protein
MMKLLKACVQQKHWQNAGGQSYFQHYFAIFSSVIGLTVH